MIVGPVFVRHAKKFKISRKQLFFIKDTQLVLFYRGQLDPKNQADRDRFPGKPSIVKRAPQLEVALTADQAVFCITHGGFVGFF